MCRRCVNLSCPLNNVPDDLKAAYLEHNPHLVAAGWKTPAPSKTTTPTKG
jgi:hypothetical protein